MPRHPSPRRRLTATAAAFVAAVASLFGTLAGSPSSAQETSAPSPALVIEGKGWGHGVGMAQDGAHAMGQAGATTAEILDHFYPGTSLGRATGTVKVQVLGSAGAGTIVGFPGGGQIRDDPSGSQSPGFPIDVGPGGTVELSFAGGRYTARALSGLIAPAAPPPTLAPAPPTSSPSAAPEPTGPPPPPPGEASSVRALWAHPRQGSTTAVPARNRRYRGVIRAEAAGGGLRLVNELDVEQYLRGMGEVRDPGWPAAGLGAQAVAARTYALRTMANGGEICDTDRCQVYLGQTVEYPAMDQAVAGTAGQVVMAGSALALTVYSASAGGFSATPTEGFGPGSTDLPYLVAAPYPTEDPHAWVVRTDVATAGRRLGYRGAATSVQVSRAGPSGRPLEVTVDGEIGPMVVAGHRVVSVLDLRSNLFSFRTETPVPPEPPPVEASIPVTTVSPFHPRPVADERVVPSASGEGAGPAVILGVVMLLVVWLGFSRRRDAGARELP